MNTTKENPHDQSLPPAPDGKPGLPSALLLSIHDRNETQAVEQTDYKGVLEDPSQTPGRNLKFIITDLIVEGIPEEYSKYKGKALKLALVYTWGTEVPLEQTSPTTWKYSGLIILPSDITTLTIMVHSRRFIAYGWLSENDLDHFRENGTLKHRFKLHLISTTDLPLITLSTTVQQVQQHDYSKGEKSYQHIIQSSDTGGPTHECPVIEMHKYQDSDSGPDHLLTLLCLLSNSYPQKGHMLASYGDKLWEEFTEKNNHRDLDNSILAYRQALKSSPDDDKHLVSWLDILRILLNIHYDHTGNLDDLVEAISTYRSAVNLTTVSHLDLPSKLLNLGALLQRLFDHTGAINDLLEAVSFKRSAVQLTSDNDPNLYVRLGNLGESLQSLFNQTGVMSDLAEGISSFRQAIQLAPDGNSNLPSWLNSLGDALQSLYDQTGVMSDLLETISFKRHALQLTSDDHPNLAVRLGNFGISLQILFDHTGVMSDLLEAVFYKRRAVQLTPDDHPDFPSWLANLGMSLLCLFNQTAVMNDLSEAISCFRQAIELTPDGHPNLSSWLNNLGNSLQKIYEETEDISYLSEAVSSYRYAVQLTSDNHPKMSARLGNLGVSLQSLFYRTGVMSDLSEAISVFRQAVQLTPDGHTHLPIWLNNLGNSLQSLFNQTKVMSDLLEAITFKKHAVGLTPDGHPDLPSRLHDLGIAFELQFTQSQDQSDILSALNLYKRASTSYFGAASKQLSAARQWVKSSELHDPTLVLDAYAAVINLVTQVAGIDQTVELRHQALKRFSTIVSAAAAAALTRLNSELALEWLEQGRCLVWNQLNQLRSPLDDLHAQFPDLAHQFRQLSLALENAGSRQTPLFVSDSHNDQTQKVILADEAHAHIKLAQQRDHLLEEIRNLPQFSDFLRPRKASSFFSCLPSDGLIVIINIHKEKCDAIALISDHVTPLHIPLKDFTFDKCKRIQVQLVKYLSSKGIQMRDADRAIRRSEVKEAGAGIYEVLKNLWVDLVKPILEGIGYNRPTSTPGRIWWCVTGPLTFLPIHAAGIYDEKGSHISDFVVSSYIPTVSILVDKIKNNSTQPILSRLLLISQAKAPGLPHIPNTEKETSSVSTMVAKHGVDVLRLDGDSATTINVNKEMLSYSSIHLACHGVQDIKDPLKSSFCLGDGRWELSEIMKKKIPQGDLAFLSACQTSKGDLELSEEAVHLAAGMLAAGYRSVVATMWAIKDEHGPVVAKEFYKHMLGNGDAKDGPRLDGRKAAYALHHATQCLRKKLGDTEDGLLAWLPYVHYGV